MLTLRPVGPYGPTRVQGGSPWTRETRKGGYDRTDIENFVIRPKIHERAGSRFRVCWPNWPAMDLGPLRIIGFLVFHR